MNCTLTNTLFKTSLLILFLSVGIVAQAQTFDGPIGVGGAPGSSIGWGMDGGNIVTIKSSQGSVGTVVQGADGAEAAFGIASIGGVAIDAAGNTDVTKNYIIFRTEETDLPNRYSPTERLRIEHDGTIIVQKQIVVPRVSVRNNAVFTIIPNAQWTVVNFPTGVDDPFHMQDVNDNDHVTVVRDGSYDLSAIICFNEPAVTSGVRGVRFRVNSPNGNSVLHTGAIIAAVPSSSAHRGTCVSSHIPTIRNGPGQVVKVEVFQDSGGPLGLDPSEFGVVFSMNQQ